MISAPPRPADQRIHPYRRLQPAGRRRLHGWHQQGFSLLEVVVAFAVLALSLGVLMQIFSSALNTTALSREYSRAATLAESRLDAVGVDIPLEPGSYGGEREDGLSWLVQVTQYLPEDLPPETRLAAFLVTAEASFGEPARRRTVALATLRLGDAGAFGADTEGEAPAPPPARGESPRLRTNRRRCLRRAHRTRR